MNKIFATNSVFDDAKYTVKKRNIITVTLIFLLVFIIGQFISSALLTIPVYIHIFDNEDLLKVILENGDDYMAISDMVNGIMEEMPDWLNLSSLLVTAGSIFAVIFYCTRLERRSLFSLGFAKKGFFTEYLIGLGIGLLMFGSVFGIVLASGQVKFNGFNPEVSVPMLIFFFIGFIIQGASEEILTRGYYLVSAATSSNIIVAVFASSIFFSLMHLLNNGISVLALINIFLFGVFAALYFIRRGSIWGICAVHSVWNFAQGNIFGFKVSGTSTAASLFSTEYIGESVLFNGGEFGPEGGLAVTIVLVIATVVLIFMKNKTVIGTKFDFNE